MIPSPSPVTRRSTWRPRLTLTNAITAACVVVFALELIGATRYDIINGSGRLPPLVLLGGVQHNAIDRGEYWRLITAGFLHASLIHLGFNMYALQIIGNGLERIYGAWRLWWIFFVAMLVGNIVAYLTTPANDVTIGASGGIMGLFAANVMLSLRYRALRPQLTRSLVPIGLTLVWGFAAAGISNAAHLGGIAGGLLVSRLVSPLPAIVERLNWIEAHQDTIRTAATTSKPDPGSETASSTDSGKDDPAQDQTTTLT